MGVRHSGATHADIVLRVHNDTLEVTVVDNGAGTGEWVPGIGLTSMRERANELGGSLSHHPSPSGSTVTATLPLGTPGGADAHPLDSG
jgi:signal transduction histidine kinase